MLEWLGRGEELAVDGILALLGKSESQRAVKTI